MEDQCGASPAFEGCSGLALVKGEVSAFFLEPEQRYSSLVLAIPGVQVSARYFRLFPEDPMKFLNRNCMIAFFKGRGDEVVKASPVERMGNSPVAGRSKGFQFP